MGAELFVAPRADDEDESIGAFITRRFGAEATTYLAEPLLAGIHAGDVDRLSLQALFPRLANAERKHGSVIRAFRSTAEPRVPNAGGAFRSLPGGLSEMVRALVDALGATNVRLNTRVSAITGQGPFVVRTSSGDAVEARAVVLATPAYATSALVRDRDQEIAGLCDAIPYASAGTVALAFRRNAITHPLTGSGFVVPRVERTGILAASWLSSKWPHRAPDNRVLLRTFVGGARDPKALEQTDEELVARSVAALKPLIGVTGEPLFARVYRFERGNAQHEVGHLARMAEIDRALTRHPGLFITGSGFRGVGIPDCVADARATARQVSAWLASSVS
jgi:oxygen-dependent protoporphyrinogen oxidase